MHMLHHLSFAVVDLARSMAFYDAVLSPLGYVRVLTHEPGAGYKDPVECGALCQGGGPSLRAGMAQRAH